MTNPPIFTGIGVALVTIFDDSGAVDAPATAELAARLVGLGVSSVLVAGSNGEAAALDAEERVRLIGAVRGALGSETVVLAGSGAASARQACALTRAALDAGADGVLVLSPPQSSDARRYYELVVDAAAGAPVLAYNFPAVSPPGLPVAVLADLPVVGLKDSSGDLARLYEELEVFPGWLYTGSARLVLLAGALECAGAILGVANAEPELAVRALAGDAKAQRQLVSVTDNLAKSWPQALKRAVAARFGTSPTVRMG